MPPYQYLALAGFTILGTLIAGLLLLLWGARSAVIDAEVGVYEPEQ